MMKEFSHIDMSANLAGMRHRETLPLPEDRRYTAVCIRCGRNVSLVEAMRWVKKIRFNRPTMPIGVVADLPHPALKEVVRDLEIAPVLDPMDANVGLPEWVIDDLKDRSIVPSIVEEWERKWGTLKEDNRRIVEVIAAAGTVGQRLGPTFKRAKFSNSKAYRRTTAAGWPSPSKLWSYARVLALDQRIRLGTNPTEALLACNWTSWKDYRKTLKRLKESRQRCGA